MKYIINQLIHENGDLTKKDTTTILSSHNSIAIIVHLFYVDVWEEIVLYLQQLDISYDLYITIPESLQEKDILNIFRQIPNVNLYMVENRGRDILPFLQILNIIATNDYEYICKLHTKKSVTSDNGEAWRTLLYYDLIGSNSIVNDILNTFDTNKELGILTGKNLILDAAKFDFGNMENVKKLSQMTHITFVPNYYFAAGTMFWIRSSILKPLLRLLENDMLIFEDENGQSDHTLAHAFERFFGLLCEDLSYKLLQSNADYRKLDKKSIEDLAVLAFTQRFKYDLLIHSKNLHIAEKDDELYTLLTSKSYRYTKPFRHLEFLLKTLMHFNLAKINSHGTNEHKLAMAIKRRIPEQVFLFIKKIIKRKTMINQKDVFWNKPLTSISQNKGQRILIVAELSIPQCKKYRVDQKIEMFKILGYKSDVISWTEFNEARNLLQLAGLVFFYRVPSEDTVLALVDECKRLNIKTIFDVDDLIFDEALLRTNINIQNLPKNIQSQVFAGAKTYKKAMSAMDYCSASTNVLAEYMTKHSSNESFIIPNALDHELLTLSKIGKPFKNSNTIIIVYGSGTSTHDIDFQEASTALYKILTKYKYVQLVIHGTLILPKQFATLKSQIKEIPFMESSEYYKCLSSYDINIAPLETSIFNDAKSNIKYIEASIFKVATIASRVTEYTSIIDHGTNGLLTNNDEEWFQAFESLISDSTLRSSMALNAYNTVMNTYKTEIIAKNSILPILETHMPKIANTIKKIMMVNVLYKPTSFGGATIVVEELSKRLNEKEDFDVTIVTAFFDTNNNLNDDYDIVRYEANGLPVILIRLPEPMFQKLEYHNDKMAQVFTNILEMSKPDLVHFHAIQQLSASIATSCKDLDIPYIITLHDMWWVCEKQFMIMPNGKYCHQTKVDTAFCQVNCNHKDDHFTVTRANYLKAILEDASLLLSPSNFQKKIYTYNIKNKEILAVNKNGITFPSKAYTKKKNNITHFAYVGGNADHKGYQFLKNIFEELTLDNYTLTIVDLDRKLGYNSMFAADWDIKGELIISDGYTNTQESMDNFYADIDVLLFPSQCKESFGLTVREVMVRDVWVISTDAGGVVEDIVESENGNIVSMNDASLFKEKIELYLNTFDKNHIYTNAHKHTIRSYEEQTEELIAYYDNVLDLE